MSVLPEGGRKSRFSTVLDRSPAPAQDSDSEIEEVDDDSRGAVSPGCRVDGKPTVSTQVDTLELALGVAFREHRFRIEEILEENMEAMQNIEAAHELDLCKLRAENTMIREKHGYKGEQGPELFQAVAMKTSSQTQQSLVGKQAAKAAAKKLNKQHDDHDTHADKKVKPKSENSGAEESTNVICHAAGGVWQQFVAWVPNGAGLAQPTPWTSLPQDCFAADAPKDAGKAELDIPKGNNIPVSSGNFFNVLPGAINESVASGEGMLEAEGSESTGKEDDKYQIAQMFAATEEELNTSRDLLKRRRADPKGQKNKGEANPKAATAKAGNEDDVLDGMEDGFTFSGAWYVMHPNGQRRMAWDVSSMALVVYDLITAPLHMFDLETNAFLVFMEWTTRLFWTADMGTTCCTGIVLPDGNVQMEVQFIIRRYLRSWFWMDAFIVVSDWLELALKTFGGVSIVGRLGRIGRLFRLVRLLRMARMKVVLDQLMESIQSDRVHFAMMIAKLMLMVVSVSHVLGCLWWGVGFREDLEQGWVSVHNFEDDPLEAQYFACLHWALCQFSGGMDEISPTDALERFYTVFVWLTAFFLAATVLSLITSSLTQNHIIKGARSRQIITLRRFLRQNGISRQLALRMQRSAQHALSGDLTADVVELLPVVAEPLRVEMHFEYYSTAVRSHAFFADYISDAQHIMRRVCHFAMTTAYVSANDVVFSKGETPGQPRMYFVVKGCFQYSSHRQRDVDEGLWLAEPVLWIQAWTHPGTLYALGEAKVASLDSRSFQDIAERFHDVEVFDPRLYANDFLNLLNGSLESIDDLTVCKYQYARSKKQKKKGKGSGDEQGESTVDF